MGVASGEDWGSPAQSVPDYEISGDDHDLALLLEKVGVSKVGTRPLIQFLPSSRSDIASAIGLSAHNRPGATGIALPLDVLVFDPSPTGQAGQPETLGVAVNGIEVGAAVDRVGWWHRSFPCSVTVDGSTVFDGRAVCIVVMTGEHLRGKDVSPRGHPGDGKAEVYVYALRPGERRSMRQRLTDGTHMPHPQILRREGTHFEITLERPAPLQVDSTQRGNVAHLTIDVLPEAYALLI